MRCFVFFLCVFMIAIVGLCVQAGEPKHGSEIILFVDPKNGDDDFAGRLPTVRPSGKDGPLRTLQAAKERARAFLKKHPVTVMLRRGLYQLDEPLVFEAQDSGTESCPVVYKAYRNENPLISGGTAIEGFVPRKINDRNMWVADVPEAVGQDVWYFRQLFLDDHRLRRTRLPESGFYTIAEIPDVTSETPWNQGQSRFKFADHDLKSSWRNQSDVDVVVLHFWVESRLPVKTIDDLTHIATFTKPTVFRATDDHQSKGARYYVENVFEGLSKPGEWYLDRTEGKVYYVPGKGETRGTATFTAPKLPQLVVLRPGAEHLNFDGISFAHTEWQLPADKSGAQQAAVIVPGAIHLEGAKHCAIRGCTISHIGTYGIEIGSGCEDIIIAGNKITDMGAGGVKVGHGSTRTTITDNEISDGGKIFASAVGVWVGNSGHNLIAHNHIHDLNYTGVSLGWTWGYGESSAVANIVEYNHIHHVGRTILSDLGGIYTLGVSPGTILRNNLIHDCYSHSYGGWGVYTDEGSTDILIENNIVYNTKTGGFHQHYGKDNIVRNNIFAFGQLHQLQRTRKEDHISFNFEGNIIYWTEAKLLDGEWSDDGFKMDKNLYWNASETPFDFAGATLAQWQARGHDVNSLTADPGFKNPAKHDFTLAPDCPALKLGFKPIVLKGVGPRKGAGS